MKNDVGISRDEYSPSTRAGRNTAETFNGSFAQDISMSVEDEDRARFVDYLR